MNKTEQELIELGKKVAHNYRLIVGVAAFFMVVSFFIRISKATVWKSAT